MSSSIKRTNSGTDISSISWDNLVDDSTRERQAELYLWQVDIGLELSNPLYNPIAAVAVIKTAIFECMYKYKSAGVQSRCFQLLQDLYLFTKGDITSNDLEQHFEHILDALKNAISYHDVASSALELLSMLATKTFTKRKFYDSDVFQSSIINLISSHSNNKGVVRAGMTFFVEICKSSINNDDSDITISFSFSVAEKILTCMLQNITIYPEDISLFYSCFRFIEEFLDKAPKTPNNTTTISKNHTNTIIDIIVVAISSTELNHEILLLSFECLKRLKLEQEHIDKINKGPRGINIYLDFMDSNSNLSDDALNHLELIVQGLTALDIYDANTSIESIAEFRDAFVDKVKELEGDFDSVEKIYNYYVEITAFLNKILPPTSEDEKQSIELVASKLDSARTSPTKESIDAGDFSPVRSNSPSYDTELVRNLKKEKQEMADKVQELTNQINNLFNEMDSLRKSNIDMYNKMYSAVSELTDTRKELEAKNYDFEEGKRRIKDMISLTTLSQKQTVMAIEEADNLKILYKNVKEENELLRQMLETEAQDNFPNLANSEIIQFPISPDKVPREHEDTNDNENDKSEKIQCIPMEGMVSLTIVGIKEALRDHDTLLKKNYHKENNMNINLLRSDKGLTIPADFDSNVTLSNSNLDTAIDTLARITRLVYKSFKKGSYCGNEKNNHTTMSTQTLRFSLKELGLIGTATNTKQCTLTDLDMIIVRLGIFQKISIFGFVYVVLMLALKNDSGRGDISNEYVLQKVTEIFENYLNKQKTIEDNDNMNIILSDEETTRVNKMFDEEKLSLKNLFLSYLPNVPRLGYDESKELVPTTAEGGYGISLEIIIQFCRDFNLTPGIINTSTIIKLFEHVLSTGFVTGHGEPLLNFFQFQSFLLHICVKCSYFEDYHGRDTVERRLYNLFYYLDHSSGFESISQRDRSMTITRFKLIYAREDARINKQLQQSMKKKTQFMKENIALKKFKTYKPM